MKLLKNGKALEKRGEEYEAIKKNCRALFKNYTNNYK
jgi:hypothetical protein